MNKNKSLTNNLNKISCVLIVKNGQSTIRQVLESLQSFSDVVIYNNHSTDDTVKIASGFQNTRIINGDFFGFGPTKNEAAVFAKNEWVLSLDADEVLGSLFLDNLSKLHLENSTVFTLHRTNYYKYKQIKHCWSEDKTVRLYNKNKTSFTNNKVHEKIITNGLRIENIDGPVKHFPYSTMTDFILKIDRYSTLFAEDNVGKKSSSPLKAILNSKYSFIKTYIFKRGFLDGYAGFVIAFSHMATNFYKYMKLYEMNQELSNKSYIKQEDEIKI